MARLPSLFVLLASVLLAPTTEASGHSKHAPVSAPGQVKRDFGTCEQTYGLGWTRCGEAGSAFCYNPSEGQHCCQDTGFCDSGTYCAPVAGYCCVDGEDFGTCADRSGFVLPTTLDATWTTTWTRTTTVTIPKSRTAGPAALATPTRMRGTTTIIVTLTETACPAAEATIGGVATMTGMFLGWNSTGTGGSSNGSSSTASTTWSPATPLATPGFVQMSDAMREQWTLVWTVLAMGCVGVFMNTC